MDLVQSPSVKFRVQLMVQNLRGSADGSMVSVPKLENYPELFCSIEAHLMLDHVDVQVHFWSPAHGLNWLCLALLAVSGSVFGSVLVVSSSSFLLVSLEIDSAQFMFNSEAPPL